MSDEILYAEDNPADAELALRTLRKCTSCNVVWVQDGVQAVDFVFRRGEYADRSPSNPRLILLDLKMPRMDGIDVLRMLKEDEQSRSIPVVIMTSSHEESDLVRSYQLGVNSYVVKPMDLKSFQSAVEEVGVYWLVRNQISAE